MSRPTRNSLNLQIQRLVLEVQEQAAEIRRLMDIVHKRYGPTYIETEALILVREQDGSIHVRDKLTTQLVPLQGIRVEQLLKILTEMDHVLEVSIRELLN